MRKATIHSEGRLHTVRYLQTVRYNQYAVLRGVMGRSTFTTRIEARIAKIAWEWFGIPI